MPRILTLNTDQAQKLRKNVQALYQNSTGKPFESVTYLGAYEHLQKILISQLSEENQSLAPSISPHRLRKLLYYTNPQYTEPAKLELLTFGSDFIEALEKLPFLSEFTGNEKPIDVSGKKNQKRYVIIIGAAFLIAIIGLIYKYNQKPYFFRDDFDKNSLEDLKARGWDVMDFDSSLFYPQDSGILILRSAVGDYYMRGNDTPFIKNACYYSIPELECFDLTMKISFPNCIEEAQTCGVYLLEKSKIRSNHIRIAMGFLHEFIGNLEYDRGFLAFVKSGINVKQVRKPVWNPGTPSNAILLRISREGNKYTFSYQYSNEEYAPFESFGVLKSDQSPRYLVLYSQNAFRVGHGLDAPLSTAPSIPAFFDWVKVSECD